VAGGSGPGALSDGEGWALKRRSRRGVKMGERVEQRERGRAAQRQHRGGEKGREKDSGPAVECHVAREGHWA
jgi:hypothetical protein